MRRVDHRAIDTMGIPGLALMEAAGRGIAERVAGAGAGLDERGVLILCGRGNNGGDGLVVARHLARLGVTSRVLLLARPQDVQGDAAANLRAALEVGIEIAEVADAIAWEKHREALHRHGLIVDALLGTGVRGGARGLYALAIEDVSASRATIVSIDLPSGLDADSGEVVGPVVRARHTYTLCRPKLPLVVEPGASYAGTWEVVPIGIPDEAVAAEGADLEWLDAAAVRPLVPPREPASHKGTYGHLLAVAGSRGKSGAAVLLARGALRAGVGLVTVATPVSVQPIVAVQQAEVMTEACPETRAGTLARRAASPVLKLLAARDALAIGPGLGTREETRTAIQAIVAARNAPAVLDADGLNAFTHRGGHRALLLRAGPHALVLTPHPGEAGELLRSGTESIQIDRLAAARRLAEATGAVVALKGRRTVIASPDGTASVNSTGNPGMATGGTGDVLTGMVGAYLARGFIARDAARLAVFIHGDAGDRAVASVGEAGMIASDLVERIPEALQALANAGAT